MRAFRYLLDPLCLLACSLYIFNRFVFQEIWSAPFLHHHFNDLLLIPAALPPVLWLQRRMGVRSSDRMPTWGEISLYLVVWAVVAEGLGPLLFPWATGDWRDVAAYFAGAVVAGGWWWSRDRMNEAGRPDFSILAPIYDALENVLAGKKLEACRRAFLAELPPASRVLLAGEGHGRFLASLLRAQPSVFVTCVESCGGMIERARQRLQQEGLSGERVDFVKEDFFAWQGGGQKYDVIVTQFVFDCYPRTDVQALVRHLALFSQPGSRWLVADFQVPSGGMARWRAWLVHRAMYLFFRAFTRLPASEAVAPAPFLQEAGYVRERREEFDWGLLYAELWKRG